MEWDLDAGLALLPNRPHLCNAGGKEETLNYASRYVFFYFVPSLDPLLLRLTSNFVTYILTSSVAYLLTFAPPPQT
jgi:hypothetical protein